MSAVTSEPQREAVTIGDIRQLRRMRSEFLALGLEAKEIERFDRCIWAAEQFFLLYAEPSSEDHYV